MFERLGVLVDNFSDDTQLFGDADKKETLVRTPLAEAMINMGNVISQLYTRYN